ncbi:MAG: acetyltransferase [Desulfovibrionaceae bacterium]
MKVVIIGAGGHGQVVADILFHMWRRGRDLELLGFLDSDPELTGKQFLGLKVLGTEERLDDIGHDAVVLAIGDNRQRMIAAERLEDELLVSAIHPSAVLAPDVSVKPGAMICAGAVVNPGSVIGPHAIINTGATVDHHNQIGAYSHIAPGVNLGGEVVVGTGALVGIGSSVVPRVRIGDWAVAGAGAVVTRDVPDGEIWAGVPARKLS